MDDIHDNSAFMEQVTSLKEQYFSTNSKNSFFKKSQKLDCAKFISDSINLDTLIDNTVYAIDGKNIVFINYPIFKFYANPDNYNQIIEHIIAVFKYVIQYYNNYEIYINLDSFTVSAAERYKEVIRIFCDTCLKDGTNFSGLLNKFHILNTPNVMEMIIKILKPLADPLVIEKIQFYTKTESADLVFQMAK